MDTGKAEHEARALEEVVQRLVERFPDVAEDRVRDIVRAAHQGVREPADPGLRARLCRAYGEGRIEPVDGGMTRWAQRPVRCPGCSARRCSTRSATASR